MNLENKLGSIHWLCIGLCVLVAGGLYRVEASWLPGFHAVFSNHVDLHEYAGRAFGRAQLGARVTTPSLYVLGTSSVRRSLPPQDSMRQTLSNKVPDAPTYFDLNAAAQRPAEAFFLATLSEPRAGDLYVYFISPASVTFSREENVERLNGRLFHEDPTSFYQQYLSPSFPHFRSLLQPERYNLAEFLAYMIDKRIRTLSSDVLFDGRRPVYQRYQEGRTVNSAEWKTQWARITERKIASLSARENMPDNIAMIKALEAYLNQRGARLHLLVAPHPQDLNDEYDRLYRDIMEEVCGESGKLNCTDLNPAAGLARTDFNDPVHANASGRATWSRVFTQYLVNELLPREH